MLQRLLQLLFASGAGTQVSGMSGSGKSVFLLWLILTVATWTRLPILLIDPKGDLAKAVRRHLLKMGPSVRRRIRYYAPGDPQVPQRPLHPLRVHETPGLTEYERRARQACKVSHAGHMLLTNSGDEDFDLKPQLFKYLTLLLSSVAELRMALADIVHFINPASDLFPTFTSAIRDELARFEYQELAAMRVEERIRVFSSTKNRVINAFGTNPIMQTHFGVTDVPDLRESIEEGHIVLVDLEARGNLREEDVNFLANAWVHEAFHTVLSTPEEQRREFFILADEFPRLRPSFPLIASCLRIIRGLRCHLVAAHQGPSSFPDMLNDPLLHTIMGQCGSHVIFRHINEPEAMYWGRQLALAEYDPQKVKAEHWDREQFVARQEIWTLVNTTFSDAYGGGAAESEEAGKSLAANWSDSGSIGSTRTDTASDAETNSHTLTHTDQQQVARGGSETNSTQQTPTADELRIAYGNANNTAWNEVNGSTDGRSAANARQRGRSHADAQQITGSWQSGGSLSRTREFSRSRQASWQRAVSTSLSETIVPIYQWRDVLRQREFASFDDQAVELASHVARLPAGRAFFYVATQGIEQIAIPLPTDPFWGTRRTAAKRIAAFLDELRSLPGYYDYRDILDYRRRLLERLVAEFGTPPPDGDPGDDPFPH